MSAWPAANRNRLLESALWYPSKMGWPVLACHSIRGGQCTCKDGKGCKSPGKHPRWAENTLEHGCASATTDEQIIRGWWTKWPDAHIGLATGHRARVFVLDVDPRHGGDDSRLALESKYGKLPETLQSVTGSRGAHLFYAYPGLKVKNEIAIADGLDIRGDGGFVILPPSGHITGNVYAWDGLAGIQAPIAKAPAWLLAMVCENPGTRKHPEEIPQVIPDGQKHKTCVSLAGSMRRRGCNSEEILAALLKLAERFETAVPPENLRAIAEDIEGRYEPAAEPVTCAMPEIRVTGRELRDLSVEVLHALIAANDPPKLFSRAGAPVRVDMTEDGPAITAVTDVHLRGEMTRAANFFKVSKQKDEFVCTPVSPPLDVAKDLLSRPSAELNLPPLESISESPFIRPNGTVICQPGYDPATRTFYAPAGELEHFAVPDRPTVDDIDGARAFIEEPFAEFRFADSASRANALGLLLTPELRPAIRGNVPAALLDAPQAGSGKSLIAEVVALVATGTNAPMKPAPSSRDEPEWRKALTATFQAGQHLAVFDNVEAVLSSPNFALALTAGTWSDRVLGKSELVTLPVRTIFVVTGNNISLGGDMPRRCYWIRLDAETSEPWRNRQFRHPDLKGWVLGNRGRLLSAVLTLARAWFVAGCPAARTPMLGSFEEWCRIVGGILNFVGVEGFLGNLDELYRQADPSMAAWEGFLAALMVEMPRSGFKVADVSARLRDDQSFRAVLPEDLGDMEPIAGFQRRLGNAFRKREKRRYGERALHLVRLDTWKNLLVWGVKGRDA